MADVEFNDLLLQQLREDGLIVPDQANEVVDEHERTGKPVRQVLIDMDIIAEDQLLEVIARQLGTQVINLRDLELQPEVIKTIPASVARMYNVVPISADANSIVLAVSQLLNPEVVDEIRFVLTKDVTFVLAREDELKNLINRFYGEDSASMNDMLSYFEQDPLFRKYHHNLLTFLLCYAFTENFILPLSHDEVVHGKRSLLCKMPGDEWQQFANLRLLLGLMWTSPGKKLLFMGGEFGQKHEWRHDQSLDWDLLEQPLHAGTRRWVTDLNRIYRQEAALHERDFSVDGFAWEDFHNHEESAISFLRFGQQRDDVVLVVCNFTPVPRLNYRVGVPQGGTWNEVANSDALCYGGSGMGPLGEIDAAASACHGYAHSLALTLPPLAVLVLKPLARIGARS